MSIRLLAFSLLLSTSAVAQTMPVKDAAAQAITAAPRSFTAADTIRALHRLFKSRRNSGNLFIGITSVTTLASNIAIANEPNSLGATALDGAIIATGIAGLYTAPFWVTGASQLVRFSRKKEQKIIDAFQAHHTLPQKIKRRLKAKHFVLPAIR